MYDNDKDLYFESLFNFILNITIEIKEKFFDVFIINKNRSKNQYFYLRISLLL